jgi:uncharacterized protein YjbI with pentapeptide repeats
MADRFHDMGLDQISAQLPQRPAAIRQPHARRRLFSQPHQFRHLRYRNPRGDTTRSQLFNCRETGLLESVQSGIDGVRMDPLRGSNLSHAQSHPVQNQGFSTTLLMRVSQARHALTQLSNLEGRGTANFHGTRHDNTSVSECYHSNNDL